MAEPKPLAANPDAGPRPVAEARIEASLTDAGLLPYGLQDIEQVRLLLQGDSVVDWQRLAFRDREDAHEFLRLCGFDPDDLPDMHRLANIRRRAVDYLRAQLSVHVPAEVAEQNDIADLLLLASRDGPLQRDACIVLKTMHVDHHVTGRELLYRLPVPINELFHRVETKVFDALDGMKTAGVRVAEFAGSRKTHNSILTKLLCRADTLAAQVHDRLRFRVVTESLEDLLAAMVYITRSLLPFNYIVPGESRNDLVDLLGTLRADPRLRAMERLLQPRRADGPGGPRPNHFSANGFRMVNFVADMPVRVDDLVVQLDKYTPEWGHVVFLLVEFQLVDRETARTNEIGENSHTLYKLRQQQRVVQRLGAEATSTE